MKSEGAARRQAGDPVLFFQNVVRPVRTTSREGQPFPVWLPLALFQCSTPDPDLGTVRADGFGTTGDAMGFSYRKRVPLGRNAFLNFSKRGASATLRRGRFTVNSRGRTTVRLAKGLSWRGGCGLVLVVPFALACAGVTSAVLLVR